MSGRPVLSTAVGGVPDILSRIKPIFRSLLRPRRPEPAVAELKPWVRAVVTLYLIVLVPELILLVISMVMGAPRVLATTYDSVGLQLDRDDTSFFYADPKIVAASSHGMAGWRRELFATLQRNARPLPDDLRITAERRVELGVTVEI